MHWKWKNPISSISLHFHIITKQILRLGEKGPQVAKQALKRCHLEMNTFNNSKDAVT